MIGKGRRACGKGERSDEHTKLINFTADHHFNHLISAFLFFLQSQLPVDSKLLESNELNYPIFPPSIYICTSLTAL